MLADAGSENVNAHVDELIQNRRLASAVGLHGAEVLEFHD
jgi:hypothetical protein